MSLGGPSSCADRGGAKSWRSREARTDEPKLRNHPALGRQAAEGKLLATTQLLEPKQWEGHDDGRQADMSAGRLGKAARP